MTEGNNGGHEAEGLMLHFDPEAAAQLKELADAAGLPPEELIKKVLGDEELYRATTPMGRLAISAARWFAGKRIPEPPDTSNVTWVDFGQRSQDIPPEPPAVM